jgi:hypothetical protein
MPQLMKWITIGQYFYRLYIAVLSTLLVPIFSFVLVYLLPSVSDFGKRRAGSMLLLLSIIITAVLLIQFLIFNKRIKSIRKDQGLRLKLEKYFHLTIVRYRLLAMACLVLIVGFYITRDDQVTGLFIANLILAGGLCPTSTKVCNDLKLKGDEREMVFYKKDFL